ncbi:hypothetical protein LIA77_07536 [Sarocladium implicatum]|nr:hypothetical protein LIA77_07536 [Sarocladium implicatum]
MTADAQQRQRPKVQLVPWDPCDAKQYQRMIDQRIACGWRSEEVPEWKAKALKGVKLLYWVKIEDCTADQEEILAPHLEEFPYEKEPLTDTATTIGGCDRTPSRKSFFSIGHIALDVDPGFTKKFDLPLPDSAIWVKSLYISHPLQSLGLGRASMAAIEHLATLPPINATMLALDTIKSEMQLSEEMLSVSFEGTGRQRPAEPKANEEWYRRQGYEVVKVVEAGYDWTHAESGKTFPLTLVFMSKKLEV